MSYSWKDINMKLNIDSNNVKEKEELVKAEKYYYDYYMAWHPSVKFSEKQVNEIVKMIIEEAKFRVYWSDK